MEEFGLVTHTTGMSIWTLNAPVDYFHHQLPGLCFELGFNMDK